MKTLHHLCYNHSCKLSYGSRLVYSFLTFRARKEKRATPTDICTSLRLNLKTVTPALTELEKRGAVSYKVEFRAKPVLRYRALPLPDGALMIGKKSGKPQSFKVRIPQRGAKVNPLQNILYWFLVSLVGKFPTRKLSYTYLVTVLNVSKGRIRNSLKQLTTKGMLKLDWEGSGFIVTILPLGDKEGWFPALAKKVKKEDNASMALEELPPVIAKLPQRCHKFYRWLRREGLSVNWAGNVTLWTERPHWNKELLDPYWLTEEAVEETIKTAKQHCQGKSWYHYSQRCIINVLKARDVTNDYSSIEKLKGR